MICNDKITRDLVDIPFTSLRTAEVMKILITSSSTVASKTCRGDSKS